MFDAYAGIVPYLSAISSLLSRDEVRPEIINFQASADAAGLITQAPPQRVSEDYDFAVTKIVGFFNAPTTNPADIAKLSFTIRDPGEGRSFFRNATNLASIMGTEGKDPIILLPPYILPHGASIEVAFNADLVTIGAWGGTAKVFGLALHGSLVRPGYAARCATLIQQPAR